MPRLRRSDHASGLIPSPSGLGSRLAVGPPGLASMAILRCHFFLNLPQASWLLPRDAGAGGMTRQGHHLITAHIRIVSIMPAKLGKSRDCFPSDTALSGSGCTSMIRPSAPAARLHGTLRGSGRVFQSHAKGRQ